MTAGPIIAPDAAVDLQLHTTFSDGSWTAEELLDYVAGEGFAVVAVTDHDRTDTVPIVQRLAAERGVRVLPAAELSSEWEGLALDLLCFGFSPGPSPLETVAADIRARQEAVVREVHATLLARGLRLPREDEVLVAREGALRSIADLMAVLAAHGYDEAADYDLIRDAGARTTTATPAEIAEAAHASGAVCLIAHPARGDAWFPFDPPALDRLRAAVPIDGFETRHPTHTPAAVTMLEAYAAAHDLLTSTGSDSHGPPGRLPIKYPAALSRRLLERLGMSTR